ncbi:anti-sigma factor family protein [Cellulomonas palmilytica]|uniref:anti-sigma factor family protein n=1 Tax=Cellulomonas palmilytica TaxID=2608402 RepID=UPI001F3D3CE8|nr:zf-HC2 domain-containing protein [Cellulomonas palmilytica]UJP41234.1 zf-HC2 domain-containing protein [Cellulomonas palmilytica]
MTHHLGSQLSALVDGRLSAAATERVLTHVARCPQCADELSAARLARRALAAAASDDVPLAPDLTARLMSLAGSVPAPAPAPVPAPRDPFAQPAIGVPELHGRRARALRGEVAQRRQVSRLAAGSLAGVGAIAAMLFVLGDRPAVSPVGHPGEDLDLLGSASAASVLAAAAQGEPDRQDEPGLAQSLRARGWAFPDTLPAGWSITGTRWDDEARELEIDLAGPQGTLVVTEQEGRLDTTALRGAERVTIGEHQAYVLSYAPWHVVWQCDSTVVQVVSGGDASAIVEAFPAKAFDGGLPARMSRGWSTVAGVIGRP